MQPLAAAAVASPPAVAGSGAAPVPPPVRPGPVPAAVQPPPVVVPPPVAVPPPVQPVPVRRHTTTICPLSVNCTLLRPCSCCCCCKGRSEQQATLVAGLKAGTVCCKDLHAWPLVHGAMLSHPAWVQALPGGDIKQLPLELSNFLGALPPPRSLAGSQVHPQTWRHTDCDWQPVAQGDTHVGVGGFPYMCPMYVCVHH